MYGPCAPTRPMRALLCGYYGEHNLGDDALLEALLAQLPEGCQPLVGVHDQALVQQRFGVATCDRRRLGAMLRALRHCDALVLGGGSLLQDTTSFQSLIYYLVLIVAARSAGRPVLLWGQGLGPLRRRLSRLLVRLVLPLATAISWRDGASATLARRWGVVGTVGSDPVWSLPAGQWHGKGGPIVLCWRPVAFLSPSDWQAWLSCLDGLAAEADRPVHWLPFHRDQDQGLLTRLSRQGLVPERLRQRSQELVITTPEEAMVHFAGAGLVLAMRLHGLILAALAGSPCAALSYDPKVAAAARGIGCPCQDLSADPDPGQVSQWRGCLDQPAPADRLDGLRQQADHHRLVLKRLGGGNS